MKKLLKKLSLSILALFPFALLALWFGWTYGMLPDVGSEFGYYGPFNRMKHVIEEMPDVRIVDHWKHRDLTLEDFGFTLLVDESQKVDIQFLDGTSEKNERDKARLERIVRSQLESNKRMQSNG